MQRQLTINYQFQLLAIDLRLLDKTFGSNLTGGQCSCPVAACARGGVAKSGSRWGVACWQRQGIAMNRRLASAWCGSQQDQAHSNVFPFSLFLFSSSRWESVATQAFARFLSFPTHSFHVPSRNDRGELLGAVVWPCDWIGAADRGRPWPETWSWLRIAPGSGQQHQHIDWQSSGIGSWERVLQFLVSQRKDLARYSVRFSNIWRGKIFKKDL